MNDRRLYLPMIVSSLCKSEMSEMSEMIDGEIYDEINVQDIKVRS